MCIQLHNLPWYYHEQETQKRILNNTIKNAKIYSVL